MPILRRRQLYKQRIKDQCEDAPTQLENQGGLPGGGHVQERRVLTNEELAKVRVGVGLVVRKWSRKGMQSKKCAGQSAKYRWFDVVEHRGQSTGLVVGCIAGFAACRVLIGRFRGWELVWGWGCWRAGSRLGWGVRLWVPVRDKLDGETGLTTGRGV